MFSKNTESFPKPQKPRFFVPRNPDFESGHKKTQNFGYSKFTLTKNLSFLTQHYSANG